MEVQKNFNKPCFWKSLLINVSGGECQINLCIKNLKSNQYFILRIIGPTFKRGEIQIICQRGQWGFFKNRHRTSSGLMSKPYQRKYQSSSAAVNNDKHNSVYENSKVLC